jgi:RNA polymerase sigma factor (sigma-70 family)
MPKSAVDGLLRELRTFIAGQIAEGQTDRCLLEQFLTQRDQTSFAALLERHGRMVLGVCRRVLHDEHLADDAFQATFLLLARQAEAIRKRQSVGSWLHGVALRLARKAKAAAARATQSDTRSRSNAAVDPHVEASWHEAQKILDDALQRLPEKYRLPLILCYLEGLTRDEAAVQLGWTAGKLKGLLDRGRDKLRAQLVRRGVTLSAAGATTLLTDTVLSASVPPLLAVATIHAAARVAAGTALAACGASASVIALAEGGLAMMASKKMALILALVLVVAIIGSGAGIFAQWTEPFKATQPDPPPMQAVVQEPLKNKEPMEERVDRFGDALPPGALMRLGTSRFRHKGEIYSMAYSSDGRHIVTGNAGHRTLNLDSTVIIWDANTGRALRTFDKHAHVVRSVAFSPDGKWIAIVNGYGKLVLHDIATGKQPWQFETDSPELARFTADGSTLLVADGRNVRRWDLAAGKELETVRGHTDRVFSVAVAAKGKMIASCSSDGTVRLYEADGIRTPAHRHTFVVPKKYGLGVALSPDGKRLVCGTIEGEVHLWDTATFREIRRAKIDAWRVSAQAFSPDGQTFVTGGERTFHICDAATGKVIHKVDGPFAAFSHVLFCPDGKRIATAGNHAQLQFWDPATGKEILYGDGHKHAVASGAFAPDGKTLATVSDEPFIHLWDLATGNARQFAAEQEPINAVAFSPLRKHLVTSASLSWPALWDLSTGKELCRFTSNDQDTPGGMVQFSTDGKTLAASTGGLRIRRWYVATRQEQPSKFEGRASPLESPSFPPVCLKFALAPDGKTFATTRMRHGADSLLWDIAAHKERVTLGNGQPIAFTPDGRCVAVLNDQGVSLLDPAL